MLDEDDERGRERREREGGREGWRRPFAALSSSPSGLTQNAVWTRGPRLKASFFFWGEELNFKIKN